MKWIENIFGRVDPVVHVQPEISFLGEQDGPVEQDIKSLWIPLLAQRPSVRRAYLAIVSYDHAATGQVALCISDTEGDDRALVDDLAGAFSDKFNKNAALDIMFLRPEHEMRIREVCRPFYEPA
jgi:hypothetical protein